MFVTEILLKDELCQSFMTIVATLMTRFRPQFNYLSLSCFHFYRLHTLSVSRS